MTINIDKKKTKRNIIKFEKKKLKWRWELTHDLYEVYINLNDDYVKISNEVIDYDRISHCVNYVDDDEIWILFEDN